MAKCNKSKDISVACALADLNMITGMLAIPFEAFGKLSTDPLKKFLIDVIYVVDPTTQLFPVTGTDYYPIKIDWAKNAVNQNYEVVSKTNLADGYTQTVGKVIVMDSENYAAKESIANLTQSLWVIVAKLKGVSIAEDTFHVFGADNGLAFVLEPTSVDFANRVVGTFTSVEGASESNATGYNYLEVDLDHTNAKFNGRFDPSIVP
jgi:hypothetical protein